MLDIVSEFKDSEFFKLLPQGGSRALFEALHKWYKPGDTIHNRGNQKLTMWPIEVSSLNDPEVRKAVVANVLSDDRKKEYPEKKRFPLLDESISEIMETSEHDIPPERTLQ